MFRQSPLLRQCVTASLRQHLSPLCIASTRPCLTPTTAIAHTQQHVLWKFLSKLVGPAPTQKRPRKRNPTTKADKIAIPSKIKQTAAKTSTKSTRKSVKPKDGVNPSTAVFIAPKKRGRPPKTPVVAPATPGASKGRAPGSRRLQISTRKCQTAVPRYKNLAEYRKYMEATGTSMTTSVAKGTEFEYMTIEALEAYHFVDMERCGRTNDKGIDVTGHWDLPDGRLQTIIQCKRTKVGPRDVRELWGACWGTRARYRGSLVMAILSSSQKRSPSVESAMDESSMPMGFVQVNPDDGLVKQIAWNEAARKVALDALTVNQVYGKAKGKSSLMDERSASADTKGPVALSWMGKQWSIHP